MARLCEPLEQFDERVTSVVEAHVCARCVSVREAQVQNEHNEQNEQNVRNERSEGNE